MKHPIIQEIDNLDQPYIPQSIFDSSKLDIEDKSKVIT
jgi:hypothetical protein